jgi:genome maintenance exonuclease 1
MSGLQRWEDRIGKAKAEEIRNEAARVGTSMHKFLECYLLEEKRKDYIPSPSHSQANTMSDVIIRDGLKHVSEIWGAEVQLWYEDQYAGTTDIIGLYKGVPHIIDFKQTNKPKKKEWIEDYYLQLAAYAHAHNHVTGSNIQNGVVLMCSRDLQFQNFELNEIQFEKYSYMWFNRVKQYNNL